MLESNVEQHLRDTVRALGGRTVKLNSAWWKGIPDQMVLLPGGIMCLVETKTPANRLSPVQKTAAKIFRDLGFEVACLNSREAVNYWLGIQLGRTR